ETERQPTGVVGACDELLYPYHPLPERFGDVLACAFRRRDVTTYEHATYGVGADRHGVRANTLIRTEVAGARICVVAAAGARRHARVADAAPRRAIDRPAGGASRHRGVPAPARCAAVARAGVPVVTVAVTPARRPRIEGGQQRRRVERAPARREIVARSG